MSTSTVGSFPGHTGARDHLQSRGRLESRGGLASRGGLQSRGNLRALASDNLLFEGGVSIDHFGAPLGLGGTSLGASPRGTTSAFNAGGIGLGGSLSLTTSRDHFGSASQNASMEFAFPGQGLLGASGSGGGALGKTSKGNSTGYDSPLRSLQKKKPSLFYGNKGASKGVTTSGGPPHLNNYLTGGNMEGGVAGGARKHDTSTSSTSQMINNAGGAKNTTRSKSTTTFERAATGDLGRSQTRVISSKADLTKSPTSSVGPGSPKADQSMLSTLNRSDSFSPRALRKEHSFMSTSLGLSTSLQQAGGHSMGGSPGPVRSTRRSSPRSGNLSPRNFGGGLRDGFSQEMMGMDAGCQYLLDHVPIDGQGSSQRGSDVAAQASLSLQTNLSPEDIFKYAGELAQRLTELESAATELRNNLASFNPGRGAAAAAAKAGGKKGKQQGSAAGSAAEGGGGEGGEEGENKKRALRGSQLRDTLLPPLRLNTICPPEFVRLLNEKRRGANLIQRNIEFASSNARPQSRQMHMRTRAQEKRARMMETRARKLKKLSDEYARTLRLYEETMRRAMWAEEQKQLLLGGRAVVGSTRGSPRPGTGGSLMSTRYQAPQSHRSSCTFSPSRSVDAVSVTGDGGTTGANTSTTVVLLGREGEEAAGGGKEGGEAGAEDSKTAAEATSASAGAEQHQASVISSTSTTVRQHKGSSGSRVSTSNSREVEQGGNRFHLVRLGEDNTMLCGWIRLIVIARGLHEMRNVKQWRIKQERLRIDDAAKSVDVRLWIYIQGKARVRMRKRAATAIAQALVAWRRWRIIWFCCHFDRMVVKIQKWWRAVSAWHEGKARHVTKQFLHFEKKAVHSKIRQQEYRQRAAEGKKGKSGAAVTKADKIAEAMAKEEAKQRAKMSMDDKVAALLMSAQERREFVRQDLYTRRFLCVQGEGRVKLKEYQKKRLDYYANKRALTFLGQKPDGVVMPPFRPLLPSYLPEDSAIVDLVARSMKTLADMRKVRKTDMTDTTAQEEEQAGSSSGVEAQAGGYASSGEASTLGQSDGSEMIGQQVVQREMPLKLKRVTSKDIIGGSDSRSINSKGAGATPGARPKKPKRPPNPSDLKKPLAIPGMPRSHRHQLMPDELGSVISILDGTTRAFSEFNTAMTRAKTPEAVLRETNATMNLVFLANPAGLVDGEVHRLGPQVRESLRAAPPGLAPLPPAGAHGRSRLRATVTHVER
ncbi:unnamed protein product [Amoebophrya sp. A25]|nr:unnamed protein product [Amoebophrya sp. A25]|eukprot:GSA25T00015410001.1